MNPGRIEAFVLSPGIRIIKGIDKVHTVTGGFYQNGQISNFIKPTIGEIKELVLIMSRPCTDWPESNKQVY